MGFRGSKKNTPYAAQLAAEDAAKEAHDSGLRRVRVYVKGPGAGRESAIRSSLVPSATISPLWIIIILSTVACISCKICEDIITSFSFPSSFIN